MVHGLLLCHAADVFEKPESSLRLNLLPNNLDEALGLGGVPRLGRPSWASLWAAPRDRRCCGFLEAFCKGFMSLSESYAKYPPRTSAAN